MVSTKTQEVKYTKIKKSSRAVATVTPEDNWQMDWSSDAAASSSIKQFPSNQNDHLASTEWPVTFRCNEFDSENTSDVPCPLRRDPQHMTEAPWTSESKGFATQQWRNQLRTRSCVDKTDREPSSPKWIASRFDAGQSLQPSDNSKKMIHNIANVKYL